MDDNRSADVIPDEAHGIKEIAGLARKGAGFEFKDLDTKGLGKGIPEKIPILVDKANNQIATFKDVIEKHRLTPERRKGVAEVTTLQSFIDLCNRHKDEHSVIFAETRWPDLRLLGVMDYHEVKGDARWSQHTVSYKFPVTDELKVWMENDGTHLEQAEFAAFLEAHAAELTAPMDGEVDIYERLFKERMSTPSEVIALSRSLEVRIGMIAKRAERLQTGERHVEFVEEHMNAKGEKVDIPGIFMVSVPAFMDGEPVRIPARLRYRIGGGEIKWAYQLYRPQFFIRERVKADLDLAAKETALPAYEGTPEK